MARTTNSPRGSGEKGVSRKQTTHSTSRAPSRDKELSKAFTRTLQKRGGKGARGKQ